MTNRVLNVREACAFLGVSRSSLYRLFREPGFPLIKLTPRRLGIPEDALQRWIDERMEEHQISLALRDE